MQMWTIVKYKLLYKIWNNYLQREGNQEKKSSCGIDAQGSIIAPNKNWKNYDRTIRGTYKIAFTLQAPMHFRNCLKPVIALKYLSKRNIFVT